MSNPAWDVVIIGAGPAGLSAALILGRCNRSVLLCDRGTPRSWASKAMHGFLTREGIPPADFMALALHELENYPRVTFVREEVLSARPVPEGGFAVELAETSHRSRKLLIATGVMDQLPDITGFAEAFGVSVFQCPYCDGWENRDSQAAVYGRRQRGFEMARALTGWTRDVILCTDGPAGFGAEELKLLRDNDIGLEQRRIERLEVSRTGQLSHVVLADGARLERQCLFFDTPTQGQSTLTDQLGCRFNRHGGVVCGKYEATSVPGVYVAGNIIRNVQLSIVAAAEGANAAFGINLALTRENFEAARQAR